MFRSAAFRRHMCWISDRQIEDAAQAVMAHPVRTCEFGRLDDGYIVRTARKTCHFLQTDRRSRRASKQA